MPSLEAVWFARLARAQRDVIDETTRRLTCEVLRALAPGPDGVEPSEVEQRAAMDAFLDGLGEHFGIGPRPR